MAGVLIDDRMAGVLIDDRMAHLGLKPQANSSNPLKRVKPLACGFSSTMLQRSPTCFSWF
jgi:hypothetical protein